MGQDNSADGQQDETGQTHKAEKIWGKAAKAFKRREYEEAAGLLETLIERHGEDAGPVSRQELRTLVGVTLLRLRRTEEGVMHLERAVEIAPESGRAHYKLGLGYGRLRRQTDALTQFEKALALDPDNAEYLCRLGLQLVRLDRPEEAADAYLRALKADPARTDAADALRELGHPDHAQQDNV